MRSQDIRKEGPEVDPILLGTGWSRQLLERPQVLLESTFGDAHPGSHHLDQVVDAAKAACLANGLMGAKYFISDICDGVATGHDGMNYSLPSRDIISALAEIHMMSGPFDGLITFASCDKSIPAFLMTHLRLNMPGIHVSGGSMELGPGIQTSAEVCYGTNDLVRTGQMTPDEEFVHKYSACPSCGACQYMGTASTMQSMAEALGMSLPGNAVIQSTGPLQHLAEEAGRQIGVLLEKNLCPRDIMTRAAFENAMHVHAAIAGSTNILLHLPAIAAQGGIRLTLEDFARVNRETPVLCSVMPSGKWPTRIFWYAGGIPAIMRELKNDLDLTAMTVTGKTVGENLYDLEQNGFFASRERYLSNFNLKIQDVIRPQSAPFRPQGGIAVLHGNIAPAGAVVKSAAVPEDMQVVTGIAKPFDSEEAAIDAIDRGEISGRDVVIIRYEGAQGAGMPEMLKTSEKLCNIPGLEHCALVTDGRFSGATKGPCIGHVSPEAADGGPLALVEENDLLSIDIPSGRLELVGVDGKPCRPEEMEKILEERRKRYQKPNLPEKHGVLRLFMDNASDVEHGASVFR